MFYVKVLLSTFLFMLTTSSLLAAEQQTITKTLSSKILSEQRTVTILLPDSYYINEQKVFPVLYRLDGKENIPLESAVLNKLHRSGAAPEMIIVAIENTDRARDLAPTVNYDPRGPVGVGGGGDKFLDFIEKELIPEVNRTFRTHDFKVFSGASIGGLLVLHAMQSRPHLFQGHIAYSPAVWWGAHSTLKNVKSFVAKRQTFDNYLYINIGSEAAPMRDIYDELHAFLANNKPHKFKLTADTFDDVPHAMTSAAGVFNAYHNLFLSLIMPSSALTDGVSSIKQYYKQVSFQRAEPTLPEEWVLRGLGYELVDAKDFVGAIEVFKYNIEQNPTMASAYNGLAYAYEQNNQYAQSLEQVNIALKLADKDDDGYEAYLNRKRRLTAVLAKSAVSL
ncbi:esterase [Pseudoalteromonas luteoviolacea]|uniref:alpha/beta hydrolase-fold protein n=1 Tax=Pseudoalteromonas luteoviolacea TaxID=43657 RepID=UPI001B35A107|nr:alpha/beta hydrolase-fold protein [Pseudoalteromonas luteoviolacea]MBQ4810236.1 esterase [Pseudoalteromonas luteoviolacea]